MFRVEEKNLSGKSPYFRYLFYLISSCRAISYKSWVREGEPNPFVSHSYSPREQTQRVEFVDIFAEEFAERSRGRR